MRFIVPTLLGLGTLVSARCGTVWNENIEALHAAYQSYEMETANLLTRREELKQTIKIYFHVITANETLAGGNVTRDLIRRQMDVLNTAYRPTGFSFVATDILYTQIPEWREMRMASDREYTMMRNLRQGNYSDLNIYLSSIALNGSERTLGYAYTPEPPSQRDQRAFNLDGVVIDPISMPGVSEPGKLNKGITMVHEVGHWLGLLHTFHGSTAGDPEGGCKGNGDYILDTPAEASASTGCQRNRDTCKGKVEEENKTSIPGRDPIHNYMDYSEDACQNEFTQGQIQRMMTSYVNSRLN